MDVRERHRQLPGEHVLVRLARPDARERAPPERQVEEVGEHHRGVRGVPSDLAEHVGGGVERDRRSTEEREVDARSGPQVEATTVDRVGERAHPLLTLDAASLVVAPRVALVHLDRRPIHACPGSAHENSDGWWAPVPISRKRPPHLAAARADRADLDVVHGHGARPTAVVAQADRAVPLPAQHHAVLPAAVGRPAEVHQLADLEAQLVERGVHEEDSIRACSRRMPASHRSGSPARRCA